MQERSAGGSNEEDRFRERAKGTAFVPSLPPRHRGPARAERRRAMKPFRWLGYGYWLLVGVMMLFALPRLGPGPVVLVGLVFVGSMLIGPFVRWIDTTRFGKWFDR